MNWLYTLWFGYVWPSDKGNGPEAIQQTLVYAAIAVIIIPPVRAIISRHLDSIHAKLDKSHELMRHIIKYHPDIPNMEEE